MQAVLIDVLRLQRHKNQKLINFLKFLAVIVTNIVLINQCIMALFFRKKVSFMFLLHFRHL